MSSIDSNDKHTKHALGAANPRAADRPAGGRPPPGRIIMTPQRPSDHHPFGVRPIMGFALRKKRQN
jgi:hypothetical protein